LYINDCPFSFGHCIACPQVALGDLLILALFLKQKRECNFTWLDPIQCEKKPVQFSIGFNLVWKTRVQFCVIRPKWRKKKKRVQLYIGPNDCYRSLWNKLGKRYWKYQIIHFCHIT